MTVLDAAFNDEIAVVPHAGTWIEIVPLLQPRHLQAVVPHAGTWIEIAYSIVQDLRLERSFPTRERGLKSSSNIAASGMASVVPHAGTWIEISVYSVKAS